jgi:glucose-6-phosphate 1-dehydrogenase
VIQKYSTPETQVIVYLSIAPEHFVSFINNAKTLELAKNSKVIFEKPFGKDLESAEILNQKITEVFSEDQIYRIDHYVGKEAIQNILAFRFANLIFEPLWNNKYIDNIQITA